MLRKRCLYCLQGLLRDLDGVACCLLQAVKIEVWTREQGFKGKDAISEEAFKEIYLGGVSETERFRHLLPQLLTASAESSPSSANEKYRPSRPMMTWSSTATPSRPPAAASRAVHARSSRLRVSGRVIVAKNDCGRVR